MSRGRPKKIQPVPQAQQATQEKGEETMTAQPQPKTGVLKTDPNIPPLDETDKRPNVCPWCNYQNNDEVEGPIHKKEENLVRFTRPNYQCDVCGKQWPKTALGKPWTLALERGPQWEREMRIRELRGV